MESKTMHQRGSTRLEAKRVFSDEMKTEAHAEGDQGKAYSSEKDGPAMSHLVSMVFLSTMLLCTILFLRYDNHQIGIAARAIGDMEKIIKDMETRIAVLQENPNCKKDVGTLSEEKQKLKNQVTELEKKLNDQTAQAKRMEDQAKALNTQKADLDAQIAKLTREKHVLSKRLGMKLAGGEADNN